MIIKNHKSLLKTIPVHNKHNNSCINPTAIEKKEI